MVDKNLLFDPISQTSVVAEIADQIETLILDGILREGAKLPSERDLADRMGVSRPKIREALKQLEQDGLIVSRHGEGTFVAQLLGAAMSDALIQLYARRASAFLDYLEYRREQEIFAARLAAERATRTDKAILTEIMHSMEQAHKEDDAEGSEKADLQFHSAIVDAGHNSLLIHTMASIYRLSRQNVFYNRAWLRVIDGTGDLLFQQHRDIYTSIMEGDPDRASVAAAAHIDFVRKSYETEQTRTKREKTANGRMAVFQA